MSVTTEARHVTGFLLLVAGIVTIALWMTEAQPRQRSELACAQATPGSVVALFACAHPRPDRPDRPDGSAPPEFASSPRRPDVSAR